MSFGLFGSSQVSVGLLVFICVFLGLCWSLLGLSWVSLGSLLGLFWVSLRCLLGLSWACLGTFLGLSWVSFESLLSLSWGYFGQGGIIPGNQGTRFPGNPNISQEILIVNPAHLS